MHDTDTAGVPAIPSRLVNCSPPHRSHCIPFPFSQEARRSVPDISTPQRHLQERPQLDAIALDTRLAYLTKKEFPCYDLCYPYHSLWSLLKDIFIL
jgi:hypothetical protein